MKGTKKRQKRASDRGFKGENGAFSQRDANPADISNPTHVGEGEWSLIGCCFTSGGGAQERKGQQGSVSPWSRGLNFRGKK